MQLVEPVRKLWALETIGHQVIPIGVGFAIPMMYREPLLHKLPPGAIKFLGRFGLAAMSAVIATCSAIVVHYVFPEPIKPHGRLMAVSMLAVAGYDATKAIVAPEASRTEPLKVTSVTRTEPAEPATRPVVETVKPAVPRVGYY